MLHSVKYKPAEVPQSYWDFVHKYGTIFQSKPYVECLTASGMEAVIIAVFEDDKLIGGAAVTVKRKILGFPVNAVMYFGPVVENKQLIGDILICIAKSIKKTSLFFSVYIWPVYVDVLMENPEISKWHKREVEYLHWDISGSLEDLRRALTKKKRKDIKRGIREGIIIKEIETPEEVEQFFKLHSMSMTKGKLNPERLLLYKNLIKILRPAGFAVGFLALHPETNKPIAGKILLLGMHGDATFLATGYDYQYRKLRGPDIVQWHCVEFLKSKGFVLADLVGLPRGDSPRAQGIRHYKLAWTGVYGHRYLTYTLSHGNFGLNPKLVLSTLLFSKKVINFVSGGLRGK